MDYVYRHPTGVQTHNPFERKIIAYVYRHPAGVQTH